MRCRITLSTLWQTWFPNRSAFWVQFKILTYDFKNTHTIIKGWYLFSCIGAIIHGKSFTNVQSFLFQKVYFSQEKVRGSLTLELRSTLMLSLFPTLTGPPVSDQMDVCRGERWRKSKGTNYTRERQREGATSVFPSFTRSLSKAHWVPIMNQLPRGKNAESSLNS